MRLVILIILCTSSQISFQQLPAPGAFDSFGRCSAEVCTWVPEFSANRSFERGNLRFSVVASGNASLFQLRRKENLLLSTDLKDLNSSVTTVWSPSSDWLAVTWSDGGAIGIFRTKVFHIEAGRVSEAAGATSAFSQFRTKYSCPSRGENLQTYRWDVATSSFVFVMSVYPTGDCGTNLGHTEAYFVAPSNGKILRKLTASQLKLYMRQHPIS